MAILAVLADFRAHEGGANNNVSRFSFFACIALIQNTTIFEANTRFNIYRVSFIQIFHDLKVLSSTICTVLVRKIVFVFIYSIYLLSA